MAELTFDPTKIKLVKIEEVIPNDWNPKDQDTPEYQRVKRSVEAIGLNEAIKVREYEGKYQVLDGMQRFQIASELGIKIIPIYNEGIVSDQRAREHTIWKQTQVPFNKVDEAHLVVEILSMGETIELPYTEIELEEMKSLVAFDFDQLEDDSEELQDDNIRTLSIKMDLDDFLVVTSLINSVKEDMGCTDSQALAEICKKYQ